MGTTRRCGPRVPTVDGASQAASGTTNESAPSSNVLRSDPASHDFIEHFFFFLLQLFRKERDEW